MAKKPIAKDKDKIPRVLICSQAEALLMLIAQRKESIDALEREYNAAAEIAAKKYQESVALLNKDFREKEKEITKLMKKNKSLLFEAGDVVKLDNGMLLRSTGDQVVIHGKKDEVIAALELNGLDEAVKTVKSYDRGIIETFDAAKLALIGAEKTPFEEFKYELKL